MRLLAETFIVEEFVWVVCKCGKRLCQTVQFPSAARSGAACAPMLHSKIEHYQSNSRPFRAAFSGIDCG